MFVRLNTLSSLYITCLIDWFVGWLCCVLQMSFYVHQLKKLLLPTQTTKMCLWTVQQDKAFYQSNKSPLFSILSNQLNISPEQTAKIQSHRWQWLLLSCNPFQIKVFLCLKKKSSCLFVLQTEDSSVAGKTARKSATDRHSPRSHLQEACGVRGVSVQAANRRGSSTVGFVFAVGTTLRQSSRSGMSFFNICMCPLFSLWSSNFSPFLCVKWPNFTKYVSLCVSWFPILDDLQWASLQPLVLLFRKSFSILPLKAVYHRYWINFQKLYQISFKQITFL